MWYNSLEMETLDEACETNGEWVLARAKELARATGIPTLVENRTDYQETRITHGARVVAAPGLLIRQLYDRGIWRSPEIRRWIDIHLQAGLLNASTGVRVDQVSEDDLRNWTWILLNPLVFLIEKRETLDLSSAEIGETYRRFRDVWRGNLHCEVIVPLLGVQGDLPVPVKLGKVYEISQFTPKEKNRLAGRWLNQGIMTAGALQRAKFKLSFTKEYKQQDEGDLQWEIQKEAERVISALRLAGPGRTGAPAFFQNREDSGLSITAQNLPNLSVPEFIQKPLLLDADLLKRTQVNYALLVAANSDASEFELQVSLRRFNQAYSRDNLEDPVLDYTIALESCLLRGLNDELSYRFSMRGAAVAAGKRDPVQVQSDLKRIYNARSKIVHEGRMPDPELAELCNELSRVILMCYIERLAAGESVKAISEKLDRQIIQALQRS
jgi:hypothetical protein